MTNNSARKNAVKRLSEQYGISHVKASALCDVLESPAVTGVVPDSDGRIAASLSATTLVSYQGVIDPLGSGWKFDLHPQRDYATLGRRVDGIAEPVLFIGAAKVSRNADNPNDADEMVALMEEIVEDVTEIEDVPLSEVECVYLVCAEPSRVSYAVGDVPAPCVVQEEFGVSYDIRGLSNADKRAVFGALVKAADGARIDG